MPQPLMNPQIKNTLMSMIIFLKHKAEEKNLKPVITVAKLTDMLRSSGLKLSYQQLVDLTKDPTIAPSIKSINKNQIEFNLGDEETVAPVEPEAITPEDFGEEQPETENAGDEEYNPEDFEMPEGEEAPEESPAPEAEPEQAEPKQKESTVTQMAKRAAMRRD